MKKSLIVKLLFIIFLQCKSDDHKVNTKISNNTSHISKKDTITKEEFFIGKKFYEGDELIDYSYEKGGYISKDSIITFSVYSNNKEILYCIEKLISNKDVKEFEVKNLVTLKKGNDLNFKNHPLKDSILIIDKSSNVKYKVNLKNFSIKSIKTTKKP